MEYSEETLRKVTQFGMVGYPLSKIEHLIELPPEERESFAKDFYTKGHPLYEAYHTGVDISDFKMDRSLYEKAQAGDEKAMKMFRIRKRLNQEKYRKEASKQGEEE